MAEEKSGCEISINSTTSLNLSRRDLVKLRDRIDYLNSSLKQAQKAQDDLQKSILAAKEEIERLRQLFSSLFGEQIRGLIDTEDVQAELAIERGWAAKTPEQITLAMSETTREQALSILDAIKKVREEFHGSSPRSEVQARAKAIGIEEEEFEDILRRLRRSGALVESEGMLRLL
ncbi:MAG TPA: hypothetical protein VLY86_04100 [Methanothrix sp.]|nr:hypothetical protein [Methanothrix sp.]